MTPAPHRTPVDDPCVVPEKLQAAFQVLQEKWALPIVYVLLKGPVGFNDIGRQAGAVNPATLTQRLQRLEQVGLVAKTVQSTMPPRTVYRLTDAGLALDPVIKAFEVWARAHPLKAEAE
ncbi:MAG: helix-turn-helix transcriptional regulator [Bauldia sp.]|nr:helix-turn-helix transcriptional regulator [Bauldia sp.]